MAEGGGGYDISQSTSESATQGLQNTFGPFYNGGGIRIPSWFWPLALVVVGYVVIRWLNNRK